MRVINLAVNVGVTFYMLPFLIDHLGQRYYGMWTLIGSIIAYLGYMDFGLSKAAQNFVAKAIGRNSPDDANRVLSTSFALFALLGFALLLLAVAAALAANQFLDDPGEASTFRTAIIILGFNAAVAFPVMSFNGFFSANLRYDVVVLIGLAQVLIRSILIVVVVNSGYALVAMAVVVTIVDLCSYWLKLSLLHRMYKQTSLSLTFFDRGLISGLYNYGGKAFVHSLADLLRFRVDIAIVGAWINLSMVAVYTIAGQLSEYLRQLLGMIFGVTVPVYAQLNSKGDFETIRYLFLFSSKLAAVLSVFLAGNAIVFGGYFIDIWLGPEFQDAYTVLCILLIGVAIHVSQEPAICLLYGFAEHGRYAVVAVVEGIINVALSIGLVQLYGINGVAAATSISTILTASFAFWSVGKRLGIGLLHNARTYLAAFLLVGAIHVAVYFVARQVSPDDFLTLFGLVFVVVLVEAIIIWWCLFSSSERSRMTSMVFQTSAS